MKFKFLKAVFTGLVFTASFFSNAGLISDLAPDANGYYGYSVASNLRDISNTGTFLGLSDDGTSGMINVGFSFDIFGASYNQIQISPNGYLEFSNSYIRGFYEDLNNPQGNIRYSTSGTVGNREFIVGFYDVQRYYNNPQVTFEMILHEGSNDIEYQYGEMNITASADWNKVSIWNKSTAFETIAWSGPQRSTNDFSNTGYVFSSTPNVEVPEPSTLAIFALGMIGLASRRFKKQS